MIYVRIIEVNILFHKKHISTNKTKLPQSYLCKHIKRVTLAIDSVSTEATAACRKSL